MRVHQWFCTARIIFFLTYIHTYYSESNPLLHQPVTQHYKCLSKFWLWAFPFIDTLLRNISLLHLHYPPQNEPSVLCSMQVLFSIAYVQRFFFNEKLILVGKYLNTVPAINVEFLFWIYLFLLSCLHTISWFSLFMKSPNIVEPVSCVL